MKAKALLLAFALTASVLTSAAIAADVGRHYDSLGRYTGRTDENGRSYDSLGRYTGREDDNGRHYDSLGRYTGRTDK